MALALIGKVALITGGTGGIGRAAAVAFAEQGASVVVTGRRKDAGEETVRIVKQYGAKGLALNLDVSNEDDCKRMVDQTLSAFGHLDYAFNNAGIEGQMNMIVEESPANFHAIMNTNVLGMLLSMKYEIPALRQSGGGAIVNNASIAGMIGMAGIATYVASKHAVLGLTKAAALEVARENIRINAVSPAAIETDMYERFVGTDQERREYLKNLHPIGRVGKAEEIAAAVVFLCSPGASFITGTNLALDGGFTAQ